MTASAQLALVGHGKMNRLIEQLAPEYGFEVAFALDASSNPGGSGITPDCFVGIDVAIEFSTPEAAPTNLERLAGVRVPAVCGTTGWFDSFEAVRAAVADAGTGLVSSPNFSIGVAVFRKLVGVASHLLSEEPEYGAWAWEIHHETKKDALSGTLLQLISTIEENGYARPVSLSSNRAGKHPGTHEIGFDSAADTITLRHVARNREGFARGALKAARWVLGRKGVYTFDDVLFGPDRTP